MVLLFRRILSIFLSLIMSIPGVSSYFQYNVDTGSGSPYINESYEGYPVVICPGINHSLTYEYNDSGEIATSSDGTQIGGTLVYFNNDVLKQQLKNLALPLLKSVAEQKNDGFSETAYTVAKAIFAEQETNDEGVPVKDLRTKLYDYPVSQMSEGERADFFRMIPVKKLANQIGENNIYLYTFNVVGNAMDSAEKLHTYIQTVKEQTGKDKVVLVNISLGGTVFTAYLDLYGNEDLAQVVNIVAAMDGTELIADFYMRDFDISDEYFYNDYLALIAQSEMDDIAYGYLINIALRLFPQEMFRTTVTRVMDALLENVFINTPQMWALVPSDRFDECFEKYFSDDSKPVLKEKLLRYHEAQLNFDENVIEATTGENAIRIDNICGSDLAFGEQMYSFFNIVSSAKTVNSDGIIDLNSTSMGATGADLGTTLTNYNESYTNEAKTVDISTSLLPDNTWVFCGQHHEVGYNSVVLNLATALITDTASLPDNHTEGNLYPMFNSTQNDKKLRSLYSEIKAVQASRLPFVDKDELNVISLQIEDVLNSTVSNSEKTNAVTLDALQSLIGLGIEKEDIEDTVLMSYIRQGAEAISERLVEIYGHNGFSDGTVTGTDFFTEAKALLGI